MKLAKMKKEDLELLSHKDITYYILEEEGKMNTADLFKRVVTLVELPNKTFEEKIGDYYTLLTTDKRFILLEDGNWDLRSRHTSDKVVKVTDEEYEEDEETDADSEQLDQEDDLGEDDYDDTDEEYDEDTNEELKDLVVIDEDELELEQ